MTVALDQAVTVIQVWVVVTCGMGRAETVPCNQNHDSGIHVHVHVIIDCLGVKMRVLFMATSAHSLISYRRPFGIC